MITLGVGQAVCEGMMVFGEPLIDFLLRQGDPRMTASLRGHERASCWVRSMPPSKS